jgi:hypothetical protein
MLKIITYLTVLISLQLFGCATTQQGMDKINYFIGQNADLFFQNYGTPYSRYNFENGDRVYRWSSEKISFQMPTTTTVTGSISPTGDFTGRADTFLGNTAVLECVVDVYTNSDNKIIRFRAVRDTIGKWVTSRCAEVF